MGNADSGTYWMQIDNFEWKQEYTPAIVENIGFENAQGAVAYDEAKGIGTNSSVKITFSEKPNTATLSNITVKNGDANVAYSGVWSDTDKSYTLSFADGLAVDTTYKVTVPNTVKDNTGWAILPAEGTFKTAACTFDVSSVAITDTTGNAFENLADFTGGDIKVVATTENTFSTAKDIVIVIAEYNGDVLKDAKYATVSVPANTTSAGTTFTLTDVSGVTSIKAFALVDLDVLTPYCLPAELK